MTASRASAKPDVREFEATVEDVDGREIVLSETYFYPEAGGQPADRGTLAGTLVEDVAERDGKVVHVLVEPAGIVPGETISGVVDDDFRTYCMRAHTASHVLYGAARRICDGLGYAGFDISPEKVRVDLTADEPLDDADLVELERLANRAVWDSLPVTWETLPEADARAIEGVAFNEKTEEGAMGGGEAVRVVTVDGWDAAACGGTHVRNTAEIGTIETLDRSNPGKGVTRVEFAVGPTAIDRDAAVHAAALEAATAVDADVDGLVAAVERLREENDRLEAELRETTADLLGARLREFETTEIDGIRWAIGAVEDAEPNDLREPAEAILSGGSDAAADAVEADAVEAHDDAIEADASPDALAAVGPGPAPFVVVAASPETNGRENEHEAVDAGAVVDAITDEFGGGGGGGPTFAQGGGLSAEPGEVVDWLRTRR